MAVLSGFFTRDNYDPDALAYINAVETADGQSLEPEVRRAIVRFVKGCKSDGIWTAIKASCILAGARTLTGAFVPLAGTAPTNNNFVSGDYNRKTGLKGDGSTTYLDSNRAGDADPQNSFHQAAWVVENATSTDIWVGNGIEASSSLTGASHIASASGGLYYARNRSSTPSATFTAVLGFLGSSRDNASNYDFRLGSTTYLITATSETPPTTTHKVMGFRLQSGIINNVPDGRMSFYSIGEALDLEKLDNRVTALMNAFNNYIP